MIVPWARGGPGVSHRITYGQHFTFGSFHLLYYNVLTIIVPYVEPLLMLRAQISINCNDQRNLINVQFQSLHMVICRKTMLKSHFLTKNIPFKPLFLR